MIRVLVVEDDVRIAAAHAEMVGRVAGFEAVGVVHRGGEVAPFLAAHEVDLVLLDFYLPDMTGLDVCRAVRAAGRLVDIIAVTSARDIRVVRSVMAYGVVQYLLKPFAFATFRDKLERYARFRAELGAHSEAAQHDVDRALSELRGSHGAPPPKGLSEETLVAVIDLLRAGEDGDGISAVELGGRLGFSRVTARRYLEHLVEQGAAERVPRYGRTGRPENVYRWRRRAR